MVVRTDHSDDQVNKIVDNSIYIHFHSSEPGFLADAPGTD